MSSLGLDEQPVQQVVVRQLYGVHLVFEHMTNQNPYWNQTSSPPVFTNTGNVETPGCDTLIHFLPLCCLGNHTKQLVANMM